MSQEWSEPDATPRWQLVLDLVGAAAYVVVVGGLSAASGEWSWVVCTVLLAVALAVRHRRVSLMVVLAVVTAVVQVGLGDVAYPADAAYAVLFSTLGSHGDASRRRLGLACAVVATIVAGVFISLQVRADGGELVEQLVVSVGFAAVTALFTLGGWGVGYIRWLNRRALQSALGARLEAAERRRLQDAVEQEQERARIAADMHDVVAHSLAVVAAQADGARYALHASPDAAEEALGVIGETARSTIGDLRVILARLRYQEASGPTPGHEQQRQLLARVRASGVRVETSEVGERSTSPLLALTAHRLLSESLTNALKHGDLAGVVEVHQDWSAGYHLQVTSALPTAGGARAEGSDGAEENGDVGHGIIGMRERAAAAGGTLTAGRRGERWVVQADIAAPDIAAPDTGEAEEHR